MVTPMLPFPTMLKGNLGRKKSIKKPQVSDLWWSGWHHAYGISPKFCVSLLSPPLSLCLPPDSPHSLHTPQCVIP